MINNFLKTQNIINILFYFIFKIQSMFEFQESFVAWKCDPMYMVYESKL
jgi:hypothetical protein